MLPRVHSQLFIAKGDGTGERPLLPLTGMDYSPSISADGKWVIFTSERDRSAVYLSRSPRWFRRGATDQTIRPMMIRLYSLS